MMKTLELPIENLWKYPCGYFLLRRAALLIELWIVNMYDSQVQINSKLKFVKNNLNIIESIIIVV